MQNQEIVLSQPCLTIPQLIFFNTKNRPSRGVTERHVKNRHPPLPLFVGLNFHTETRSRKLVNALYNLGVSASYQCVIDLESSLATTVCTHFEDEGIWAKSLTSQQSAPSPEGFGWTRSSSTWIPRWSLLVLDRLTSILKNTNLSH